MQKKSRPPAATESGCPLSKQEKEERTREKGGEILKERKRINLVIRKAIKVGLPKIKIKM